MPLTVAAQCNHLEVLRLLLGARANSNLKDHEASEIPLPHQTQVAKLILARGHGRAQTKGARTPQAQKIYSSLSIPTHIEPAISVAVPSCGLTHCIFRIL